MPVHDLATIARAVATNCVARVAPAAYLHLTGQTGRGAPEIETAAEISRYFRRCVDDYLARLGGEDAQCIAGKVVLEYGPGDVPGVALLLVARGAQRVVCVDRFPMVALSPKNLQVLRALEGQCRGEELQRFRSCWKDPARPELGFSAERIRYIVRPHGLSGLVDEVDLVLSRAVLEHVDDLPATFIDMVTAMRDGAQALHQVDLRSHGLHRRNPLDFLECPPWLWRAMFSHKGVPNRWRVDRYREIVASLGVQVLMLEPTLRADPGAVADVRPRLATPFRSATDDDLSWLGFWLGFRKRGLHS